MYCKPCNRHEPDGKAYCSKCGERLKPEIESGGFAGLLLAAIVAACGIGYMCGVTVADIISWIGG